MISHVLCASYARTICGTFILRTREPWRLSEHANDGGVVIGYMKGRTQQAEMRITSSNNDDRGPSVSYVNESVLKGLDEHGIRMTDDCRITNDRNLSAAEFIVLLRDEGWSWPGPWYRQNRNYFQHAAGAAHFEKEIEPGRWIHIVVSPGRSATRRRTVRDWTQPPREIELHAEKDWLRPSSYEHLWSFLRDRVMRLIKGQGSKA